MPKPSNDTTQAIADFIARWEGSAAAERSNAQTFLTELCDLLGLDHPDPTVTDETENAYLFEKSLTRTKNDGTQTVVSADLYKRGCFMLETKQGANGPDDRPIIGPSTDPSGRRFVSSTKEAAAAKAARRTGHGRRGSTAWVTAMEKARNPARNYIRDLPLEESWVSKWQSGI